MDITWKDAIPLRPKGIEWGKSRPLCVNDNNSKIRVGDIWHVEGHCDIVDKMFKFIVESIKLRGEFVYHPKYNNISKHAFGCSLPLMSKVSHAFPLADSNQLLCYSGAKRVNKFKQFSKNYSMLGNILNKWFIENIDKNYLANEDFQMAIEQLTFDQYGLLFKKYMHLLSPEIKSHILNKKQLLYQTISDYKATGNKARELLDKKVVPVFMDLPTDIIYNLCIYQFFIVASYQNAEDTKIFNKLARNTGEIMVKRYLCFLKDEKNAFKDVSFSVWYTKYRRSNEWLCKYFQDMDTIFGLGSVLLSLLGTSGLVQWKVKMISRDANGVMLHVDENLLHVSSESILNLPLNLPMIVKPKNLSKGVLGGYLFNDHRYSERLDLNRHTPLIKRDSIYDMINIINSVPYKINTQLLDYILINKHNLLIGQDKNLESNSKSTYQQVKYSSYLIKLNLQQTILGLAEHYKNFSEFYLPLKTDSLGRLCCATDHLNYQSCELAKALLLFKIPYIINKKDLENIKYLEYYGANSFGKDKLSDRAKSNWINNNKKDIINYRNGKLLSMAEHPLLFLAFCMEYNR